MSADLRERAERVKRDLSDPLAVAQALGLEVGEKGTHSVKVKCPWHEEKIASCNVRVGTDGTIAVKCFGCDKGGSVLDLIAACHGLGLRGQDFARVVELAEQLAGIAPRVDSPPGDDVGAPARRLLDEAGPDDGRIARYLRSRGLSGVVPPVLRLHPALAYYQNKILVDRFPAIVASVVAGDGTLVGVHVTWLALDGSEKAPVATPKKLRALRPGATRGAAIRLGEARPTLAVAEGIETGLAVLEATGTPVWATMSAGGMRALSVPAVVTRLEAWADRDANHVGQCAADALARRTHEQGRTTAVILPPEAGSDWLDILAARGPEALKGAREAAQPRSPTNVTPEAVPVPEEEHFTDTGNAMRFAREHGDDLRFSPSLGGWLVWDGRRWARDETGAVVRRAQQTVRSMYRAAAALDDRNARAELAAWAKRSESAASLRAMLTLAESAERIAALASAFDADPWTLNVLNGTLDLRTGQLRPHRREDLITKLAPVAYNREAQLDTWDTFLTTATAGDAELSAFLQRAVGYTLTGSTDEEKLFFAHGPEASGKSTFLEAVKATLGDYAVTADFEVFLAQRSSGGPRNDVARLAGARLVASIEVEEGKRLAHGLVKQLTGGDTVSARFLYRESFEFKPAFKLWLAANHTPKVADDDGAMWRRILRVPFEHTIPKEVRDRKVKATLRDPRVAGAAILAWAVRGCLTWQRDGLGVPPAVEQATAAYRADMDPLRDFITECCVVTPEAWCAIKSLWEAYQTWAKEGGLRWSLTKREFGERLSMRGFPPDKGSKGGRIRRGIALADGEVEEVADLNADSGNSPIRAGVKEVAANAAGVRHPRHPLESGNGCNLYGDDPPTVQCRACGAKDWWQQDGGAWVCGRCHPPLPPGGRPDAPP